MKPVALVRGRGIAGLTAARRLIESGWNVTLVGQPARASRLVTLDPSVVTLLELEFGAGILETFEIEHLEGTDLRWHRNETNLTPLVVADLADVVVSLELRCLEGVTVVPQAKADAKHFDVELVATGRPRTGAMRSGTRTAFNWIVPAVSRRRRALLVAGLRSWTFAAPGPRDSLLVQTMLPGLTSGRDEATTLSRQLLQEVGAYDEASALKGSDAAILDATPMFADPTTGLPSQLPIGDAASAGDPLGGEGIGRAIRGAILAVASVNAGNPYAGLHYAGRLARAQASHLNATSSFYASSRCANAFRQQIESMSKDAVFLADYADRHERPLRVVATPTSLALAGRDPIAPGNSPS